MTEVTIERLHITIELDGDGAAEHFRRLFDQHVQQWWQDQERRRTDLKLAEGDRVLPGSEDHR
jgi:hypothetical protein